MLRISHAPLWLNAPTWLVEFPGNDHRTLVVKAFTKSEARRATKQHFRIKDRLPVGTVVTKVS